MGARERIGGNEGKREIGVVTSAERRQEERSDKRGREAPFCPLPHASVAHLDDVGQLVLVRSRQVKGRLAGLVEHTRPKK